MASGKLADQSKRAFLSAPDLVSVLLDLLRSWLFCGVGAPRPPLPKVGARGDRAPSLPAAGAAQARLARRWAPAAARVGSGRPPSGARSGRARAAAELTASAWTTRDRAARAGGGAPCGAGIDDAGRCGAWSPGPALGHLVPSHPGTRAAPAGRVLGAPLSQKPALGRAGRGRRGSLGPGWHRRKRTAAWPDPANARLLRAPRPAWLGVWPGAWPGRGGPLVGVLPELLRGQRRLPTPKPHFREEEGQASSRSTGAQGRPRTPPGPDAGPGPGQAGEAWDPFSGSPSARPSRVCSLLPGSLELPPTPPTAGPAGTPDPPPRRLLLNRPRASALHTHVLCPPTATATGSAASGSHPPWKLPVPLPAPLTSWAVSSPPPHPVQGGAHPLSDKLCL
ncbi:basic proline-rich protein-like [Myotis daubentonii]|uniref:basic proline-rich protein-like n=1 Tax=Myotis daubentonii TaxID=98922 RepID=UPI002872BFB7|nr:basic proline-rich protein-like [Myotis daubentonii]